MEIDNSEGAGLRRLGDLVARIFKMSSQEQIVLLVTLALLISFSLTLSGFGTVHNMLNLVRSISILGVMGLGMGLVVITRGIDLSIVAIMAGSWAIALVAARSGLPIFEASLLGFFVAIATGFCNGVTVAFAEVPALFTTLATSLIMYGLSVWFAPFDSIQTPANSPALLFFGQGHIFGFPMPIVTFAGAATVAYFLLARTSIGRFIYALGDNPEAARLSGVLSRPTTVFVYVFSAVLAWAAGLIWIGAVGAIEMRVLQGPMIFDVILVVVLGGISLAGGTGGVLSVVGGCALIGTLLNALTIMDVNSEWQNIVRGAVLLAAVLLDNFLHPRDEETARQGV